MDNKAILSMLQAPIGSADSGNWALYHQTSEKLAVKARIAERRGDVGYSAKFYRQAAQAELQALDAVKPDKPRTRGITAVSAVSLLYKAGDWEAARAVACDSLTGGGMPPWAITQLQQLLANVACLLYLKEIALR